MKVMTPTQKTYGTLDDAYRFFNERLFDGQLPACLITMQRSRKAYGYFAGSRFGSRDGSEITDEIALNPMHFRERTTEQSLSTLVHEMTDPREQHHFGKPSRGGYHNKQWASMMRAIGLVASDTGAPGGKETGQRISHYIEPDGKFATTCAELLKQRTFDTLYVDLWSHRMKFRARRKRQARPPTIARPVV